VHKNQNLLLIVTDYELFASTVEKVENIEKAARRLFTVFHQKATRVVQHTPQYLTVLHESGKREQTVLAW
jgi:hypothetical protein